jgi:hypothetical protein
MTSLCSASCACRLEAKVKERTMEDLRGLVTELVAVDENGRDQLSSLEQPEVQKLKSVFTHHRMDLGEVVTKVIHPVWLEN